MIAFTVAAMAIVIFFWLMYFNNLVASLSHQKNLASDNSAETQNQDFSFLQTMKNGTAVIFEFLGDKASGAFNFFKEPKEYIIKP